MVPANESQLPSKALTITGKSLEGQHKPQAKQQRAASIPVSRPINPEQAGGSQSQLDKEPTGDVSGQSYRLQSSLAPSAWKPSSPGDPDTLGKATPHCQKASSDPNTQRGKVLPPWPLTA